ncbi:KAP family P-loop domain-containing protein [Fischerella thermalis CCMEE 5201]|nr:KAP family P-loop domain-containing protein [Fischerella thermalis CCMEE 5201]
MASINEIIQREVNPFDLVNLKTGNFWTEHQDFKSVVESIHQEAINEIEELLQLVTIDHRSRTVLLIGDSGSGKSYLLGRLKHKFNPKAFFAYIGPWAENDYIWRHVLRYTVDSLIKVPDGEQESQLMLWLKSLSAFINKNGNVWKLLLNNRQKFIKHLKDNYQQAGIYNPEVFFGVLHDLTNPELYTIACDWLKGDDISEESMQALRVKHCIDTEDAAKNILANFGKISTDTQPIVLCFDQVEASVNFDSNSQAIFNINTTIHNDNLKNFLIIISIVKDNWIRCKNYILQSDKARIDRLVSLKPINLDQAESLWADKLQSLHQKANPKPNSPIFPLTQQLLEANFPGGKTMPRNALILGRLEYQKYKILLGNTKVKIPTKHQTNYSSTKTLQNNNQTVITLVNQDSDRIIDISNRERIIAEFQLLWQQEFKKTQSKIGKISLLPATDLIKMVQEVLEALQVQSIKPKLLKGKYASYSLSYQAPDKQDKVGIVWTEDANMTSFFHIMNACQKAIQENICKKLYLIRISNVGNAKLAGYKIYNQIFKGTNHHHIKPNLISVHYLATYHSLVNSAIAQELVLGAKTITLQELQSLTRETKILNKCALLQDLEIISEQDSDTVDRNGKKDLRPVKDFMLNLVKTQSYMGVATLIYQSVAQFPEVEETDLQLLIDLLCQEQKVKIINPKAKLQDRLICLVNKI